MEDFEIVQCCLDRNESAISHMAQKYGLRLRHIAYKILDNHQAAEECENDTYLEAWNSIPPNEPRSYLFAFLGRITRHIAIDRYRKNTTAKRSAIFCELTNEMQECIPSSQNGTDESVDKNDLTQAINEFLYSCSQEQQNVFVRRYWNFDTVQEICNRYGFSQSKVKTMLCRTRKSLCEYLRKRGFDV